MLYIYKKNYLAVLAIEFTLLNDYGLEPDLVKLGKLQGRLLCVRYLANSSRRQISYYTEFNHHQPRSTMALCQTDIKSRMLSSVKQYLAKFVS